MHDSSLACGALSIPVARPAIRIPPSLAGCLLVGLILLAPRPAVACDHHEDQNVEVLGSSRGQVVLLVAEEQYDRWCPAHRKGTLTGNSYLRYELRFATLAGQWLLRRIPVETFRSTKAVYPQALPGRARRKGLALAARLPGFVAVSPPVKRKCTKRACGKEVVYEENHKPPRLMLAGPGGQGIVNAELRAGTPAREALKRVHPRKTEWIDPDHYIKGENWRLVALRRYKVGASELLVLTISVTYPVAPSGVSGPFDLLLPAPPGNASRPAPTPRRPNPTRR